MMGEMERIKAIIEKKNREKKAKELKKKEALRKKRERDRIFEIAGDEKAPKKYRQAYIDKKNKIEAEERKKEQEKRLKEAKKKELDEYFKRTHQKKLERGKKLMEKYGKDK